MADDSEAVLRELLGRANDDLRLAQGLAAEVSPRRRIAALTEAILAIQSQQDGAQGGEVVVAFVDCEGGDPSKPTVVAKRPIKYGDLLYTRRAIAPQPGGASPDHIADAGKMVAPSEAQREECYDDGSGRIRDWRGDIPAGSASPVGGDALIKAAVDRFLGWPLPRDFSPDCGISFDGRKDDEWNKGKTWPVGTNLLSADQATAMFKHCLATRPAAEALRDDAGAGEGDSDVCGNCGEPPPGCSGLFADDGHVCAWLASAAQESE